MLMVSRLRLAISRLHAERCGAERRRAHMDPLVAVAELASPLRPSAPRLADDSSHLKTRILAMDAHLPSSGAPAQGSR